MNRYFLLTFLISATILAPSFGEPKGSSLIGTISASNSKSVEGCGCYLTRPGVKKEDTYVFFGKLGDEKESGLINLNGTDTEVFKDRPDSSKSINGKNKLIQSYHSANIQIEIELIEKGSNESEEYTTYSGDLTVSISGKKEKIKVEGYCGC